MWPFRKSKTREEYNSGEKLVHHTSLHMTQNDRVRQIIRHEMFKQAMGAPGHETFEEADDFELPDGDQWVSPYEEQFDPNFDHPPGKPTSGPEPVAAPAPSQPPASSVKNEPPQPTPPSTP